MNTLIGHHSCTQTVACTSTVTTIVKKKRATLLLVKKKHTTNFFTLPLLYTTFCSCILLSILFIYYSTTKCKTLYTHLTKVERKAALIHQIDLCLSFCGLIYFSNFSRPGSNNSTSSRHRIGKC